MTVAESSFFPKNNTFKRFLWCPYCMKCLLSHCLRKGEQRSFYYNIIRGACYTSAGFKVPVSFLPFVPLSCVSFCIAWEYLNQTNSNKIHLIHSCFTVDMFAFSKLLLWFMTVNCQLLCIGQELWKKHACILTPPGECPRPTVSYFGLTIFFS